LALSLGVQAGSQIKIGLHILRVIEVLDDGKLVKIEVGDRRYMISDEERTEIATNVFVFCGISEGMGWDVPLKSKLAFEAPREIKIDRLGVVPV
jgi:hypothetical protein